MYREIVYICSRYSVCYYYNFVILFVKGGLYVHVKNPVYVYLISNHISTYDFKLNKGFVLNI